MSYTQLGRLPVRPVPHLHPAATVHQLYAIELFRFCASRLSSLDRSYFLTSFKALLFSCANLTVKFLRKILNPNAWDTG